MTKISSKAIEDEKLNKYKNDVYKALTLCDSFDEVRSFILDLLTRTEIIMLAKRLQIAFELLNGENYVIIGNRLNVGHDTISEVKEKIESGRNGFIDVYKKFQIIEQDKINKEKNRIQRKSMYTRSKSSAEKFLPELAKAAVKGVGKKLKKYLKRKSINNI